MILTYKLTTILHISEYIAFPYSTSKLTFICLIIYHYSSLDRLMFAIQYTYTAACRTNATLR